MLRLYRSGMRGLPAAVWWFAGAALVNRAGTMVLPFLGLYLRDELSLSTGAVSAVLAAFGAGSLVGIYISGFLVDRFGGHRVQIASLALGGGAFFGMVALRSFYPLLAGTFLAAALSDAFRPAVMTSVAAATDESNRARAFALVRLALNAGMAVGPALGGLLAAHDFRWVFIGDGATCWLAAGVLMLLPLTDATERDDADRSKAAVASALSDMPFLLFVFSVFVLATAFSQIFFTLPLYLTDAFGWSERSIGFLVGLNAAVIVLFELPLITAIEHRPPLLVFSVGSAFVGVGFATFLLGALPWVPVAMMLLVTVGEMLVFPMSNVVVAARASANNRGRYMALYGTSFSFAFLFAPVLGMSTYTFAGPVGLWGGATLLSLIVVPLVLGPVRRWMGETPPPKTAPA